MYNINKLKGKVVVVEGGELMGKSTLMKNLVAHFNDETDIEAVGFGSPGATEYGKAVRAAFIAGTIPDNQKAAVMVTALSELYFTEISKAVEEGKLVILDRHLASTYAYQVELEKVATEGEVLRLASSLIKTMPDMFIFLRLNEDVFLERQSAVLESGREIMENDMMSIEDARIVDAGFKKILKRWGSHGYEHLSNGARPKSVVPLNPAQTEEELTETALRAILVTFAK